MAVGICRGSYQPDMRLTFEFTIDDPLMPNFEIENLERESGFSFIASDGINDFNSFVSDVFLDLRTDENGSIVDWDILLENGSAVDVDRTRSTPAGESILFQHEFDSFRFDGNVGGEFATASTIGPGTWERVDLIAPVPLPAGGLLLLSGVLGFASMRRLKLK